MSVRKSYTETVLPWLKANLGQRALGALTSGDVLALRSAIQMIEIHTYSPSPVWLSAFRSAVLMMQPSTRYMAFHATAMVQDWDHRAAIWFEAELEPIPVGRCAFEPGGSERTDGVEDERREA